MVSLSLIIPVYNSSTIIPVLLEKVERSLPACTEDFEVIMVNDGSSDASWQVIEDLAGRYIWLKAIDLQENSGQQMAVFMGIREAKNPILVTMDDDLQHPPEEICRLIIKLNEGYNLVYARSANVVNGFIYYTISSLAKFFMNIIFGLGYGRHLSTFRCFHRSVYDFSQEPGEAVSIDGMLNYRHPKLTSIRVAFAPRYAGKSSRSLASSLRMFTNAIRYGRERPFLRPLLIGSAGIIAGTAIPGVIGAVAISAGLAILSMVLLMRMTAGPKGVPHIPNVARRLSPRNLIKK